MYLKVDNYNWQVLFIVGLIRFMVSSDGLTHVLAQLSCDFRTLAKTQIAPLLFRHEDDLQ